MSHEDITGFTTALIDVLPLVIQHSSISKQLGSMCSLLCTSQQTEQAVVENCVGKLDLKAEKPAEMAWFGKHWRLVRSLRTDADFGDAAMLAAIEQGLAGAAARCKDAMAEGDVAAPQLQSLGGFAFPADGLVHLQAFTTLTSLKIRGLEHNANEEKACQGLAGLTSLCCLEVDTSTDGLLPGFRSLTNLTSLAVQQLAWDWGIPNLRHLPPQLLELNMTLFLKGDRENQPPVDLSHVTGLTRLVAADADEPQHDGWVVGFAHLYNGGCADKLPPNCRHLSVQDIVSAQPLLELQHLERLEIQGCYPCDEYVQHALKQLTSLSSLTDLQINTEVESLDELGAGMLLALPFLRGLRLLHRDWRADDLGVMDIPVLSKLLKLSTLQKLSLENLRLQDSSGCRVADAVRGLRGLQSLRLCGCVVGEGSSSAKFASVAGAIAVLPELRDVRLAALSQWDEAASVALAAATQLTGLFVTGRKSLAFVSLVRHVHKLSGLRKLWLDVPGLYWLDVDATAASLTGLTELCLKPDDAQQLRPKFPSVDVRRIWNVKVRADRLSRGSWEVHCWSPADGDWITT